MPTPVEPVVASAAAWSACETMHLPGSNLAISVRTLSVDVDGGRTLFVRFPPQWSRPARGSFDVAEEVFVVEGRLEMSGLVVMPGEWARFPAGFERYDSSTPEGLVALARFDGVPRWHAA